MLTTVMTGRRMAKSEMNMGVLALPTTGPACPARRSSPSPTTSTSPAARPAVISTVSVSSCRAPSVTGTRSALPSADARDERRDAGFVDRGERHDEAVVLARLDAAFGEQARDELGRRVFGSVTKIDTWRVTGSAVGLMRSTRPTNSPGAPRIVNVTFAPGRIVGQI